MFIARAKDTIMIETSLKYANDPQLLLDIISAMPKRVDNTLTAHRNKILGNVPKHRDDFVPETLLAKIDGGNKIIVMDSSKDLPSNWRNIDMRKKYGIIRPTVRKSRSERKTYQMMFQHHIQPYPRMLNLSENSQEKTNWILVEVVDLNYFVKI